MTWLTACLVAMMPLSLHPATASSWRAPQFTLPSLTSDELISLSDHQGKVVYLDFWSAWCTSCRDTRALLHELKQRFDGQDLTIVSISIDSNPYDALRVLEGTAVEHLVAADPAATSADAYGLEVLPAGYLISPRGMVEFAIQGRAPEPAALTRRIQSMLELRSARHTTQ